MLKSVQNNSFMEFPLKKVLTLYSSARAKGNTFQLVDTFNQLQPGEVLYLDDLQLNEYDYEFNNQDDDFINLIDKMLSADVIVFASPVYWYSLTPAFRRFIDRFTDLLELPHLKNKGKRLRARIFYLFSTSVHSEAPLSFTSQVQQTLKYLGWQLAGTVHLNCIEGFGKSAAIAELQPVLSQLGAYTVKNRHIPQPGFAQLLCQFK